MREMDSHYFRGFSERRESGDEDEDEALRLNACDFDFSAME